MTCPLGSGPGEVGGGWGALAASPRPTRDAEGSAQLSGKGKCQELLETFEPPGQDVGFCGPSHPVLKAGWLDQGSLE